MGRRLARQSGPCRSLRARGTCRPSHRRGRRPVGTSSRGSSGAGYGYGRISRSRSGLGQGAEEVQAGNAVPPRPTVPPLLPGTPFREKRKFRGLQHLFRVSGALAKHVLQVSKFPLQLSRQALHKSRLVMHRGRRRRRPPPCVTLTDLPAPHRNLAQGAGGAGHPILRHPDLVQVADKRCTPRNIRFNARAACIFGRSSLRARMHPPSAFLDPTEAALDIALRRAQGQVRGRNSEADNDDSSEALALLESMEEGHPSDAGTSHTPRVARQLSSKGGIWQPPGAARRIEQNLP